MKPEKLDSPLVTIVTTCYNHESFLRDCLEGIVNQQTDFKFQVFVVDDASQDSSPRIIEEYASRYPEIVIPILFEENQFSKGVSHFNNTIIPMLRESPTKYVAMCEGDDYWIYPGKLQRQVDFMESHPDYTACFHHFIVKDETSPEDHQVMFNLRHSRRMDLYDLFIEPQQQTATMLMRSDVMLNDAELHSYLNKSHFSDVALFLALYNAGKVYCFREWWSVYRIHDAGISQGVDPEAKIERHLQNFKSLGKLYNGKYKGLDLKWKNHRDMQNRLNDAKTNLRKGSYLGFVRSLTGTFFKSPIQFLIYIKDYFYSIYR